MKNMLISWLAELGLKILQSLAQKIWDGFWQEMFDAIHQAEIDWNNTGTGIVKKKWVKEQVFKYLNSNVKLNNFQKWLIEKTINVMIDNIIKYLNSTQGQTWVDKLSDLKSFLQSKIPFLN